MWSTGATNASFLSKLPGLQVVGMVFLISFLYGLTAYIKNRPPLKLLQASPKSYLVLFCGAGMQQFFYILAFSEAEPAEADLIIYLWPLFSVLICRLLFKDRIRPRYWVAASLGLGSVLMVSWVNIAGEAGFTLGHLFALCSAMSWAAYSAFAQRVRGLNFYTLGVVYGVCAMLTFLLLLYQGHVFVLPSPFEMLFLCLQACAVMFAFSLWTTGVQFGKAKQLTVSSYLKPVVSMILLCSFGFAEVTPTLVTACIMVAFSGLIAQGGILDVFAILFSRHRGIGLDLCHRYRKKPLGTHFFFVVCLCSHLRFTFNDGSYCVAFLT